MKEIVKNFFTNDSSVGLLLFLAAILAMISQNLYPFHISYNHLLNFNIPIGIGKLQITKPITFWINDGLMVVFFFMVALELKREVLEGQLQKFSQIFLPSFAAIGGVVCPAIIFSIINWGDSFAMRGWAIPVATDLAFALAVIIILGKKIPTSLKLFVLTLAIMDDLYAIIIIAFFYTEQLHYMYMGLALLFFIILIIYNKIGVNSKIPFILFGIFLWIAILNSGIHPTIAGVLLAFTIPLKTSNGTDMIHSFETNITPFVNFTIMPIFAYVNSGVDITNMKLEYLLQPVPIGIMLALFFGKQIGIFFFTYVLVKFNLAKMPDDTTWKQVYVVSIICGIGFTMSLFVDNLAYDGSDKFFYMNKLSILIGSLFSGIIGYTLARK